MSAEAPTKPGVLRIVMAGGGTGGHLYPGLAVAEALTARAAQTGRSVDLVWAATPRTVDQRLLTRFGENYIRQAVQPLSKNILKLWGFWRAWSSSCSYWSEYLRTHQVHAVVALGGYAAGPAAYVAAKQKIPVILLNPDALPGRANRFLLKRANVIVTQWPLSAELSRGLPGRVMPLGCPIRAEVAAGRARAEGAAKLGIDPEVLTLTVTGASLGAKTINDAVLAMLEDQGVRGAFEGQPSVNAPPNGGITNWQIVHLTGLDQAGAVRAGYARFPQVRVKIIDYCDDMASLWAVTDLAIARAGASTCAELTACGVPSILLPYPFHKDMHQRANAQELVAVGAALLIDDAKDARLNASSIQTALKSLLYAPAKRSAMADRARAAGKPHAADEIAREILGLIGPSSR